MKINLKLIALSAIFALNGHADTMVYTNTYVQPSESYKITHTSHKKKHVSKEAACEVAQPAHSAAAALQAQVTQPTHQEAHEPAKAPAQNHDVHATGEHCEGLTIKEANIVNAVAKKMIDEIIADNTFYQQNKGKEFFEAIKNGQKPRATVVSCSDSRVQMTALDATPENDLFVIRNIGNQISSNEGSVAYGVHHLHTPLLIIVGHSRCGAIKAAMSDYSGESQAIRREVDSLSLSINKAFPTGHSHGGNEDWLKGVISNVNQQVAYALASYSHEIQSGKLTVVGGVFDLAGDMKGGEGKFAIININGETNPQNVAKVSPTAAPAGH